MLGNVLIVLTYIFTFTSSTYTNFAILRLKVLRFSVLFAELEILTFRGIHSLTLTFIVSALGLK